MIDSKQTTETRIRVMIEELERTSSFASDAADSACDCGWTKTKRTKQNGTSDSEVPSTDLLDALETELRRAEDFYSRMVNWCALPNIREGARLQVEIARAKLDNEKHRASNANVEDAK